MSEIMEASAKDYQVVARRYRPRSFEELVGQDHVGRALSNAITSGRIGHAYLFTGARGVGKTSTARIYAKALNCETGLSPTPCNECDTCLSIGSGDDVDVLEIDGASNRGIDEIRQLRQNAGIRPSRSRFKIYIIDEVHMLTREAFNALLKTLEEPPEHVKFIFCTTEPTKIPITILSRCQRFDFAGIETRPIVDRLRDIAKTEGVEADEESLRILARRAAGSMRDAQSLLEQLLSFASEKITKEDVHAMLGTADEEALAFLVESLASGKADAALARFDAALAEGVDVGLLVEQTFGYMRDMMIASVGCTGDAFLYASTGSEARVRETAQSWGVETILAAMQILEQTLARLRYSTQGRILAELALVRIAHLSNLDDLSLLINQLQSGGITAPPSPSAKTAAPPQAPVKKKDLDSPPIREPEATAPLKQPAPTPTPLPQPTPPQESRPAEPDVENVPISQKTPFTPANLQQIWDTAVDLIEGMTATYAKEYESLAISAPKTLVVTLKAEYTSGRELCSKPGQIKLFEKAVESVVGDTISIVFDIATVVQPKEEDKPAEKPVSMDVIRERLKIEVEKNPIVQSAKELFGANVLPPIPPKDSVEGKQEG
jgi:DNA polymerase III subunit gamma/tau